MKGLIWYKRKKTKLFYNSLFPLRTTLDDISNGSSSPASLESPPALVAPKSHKSIKKVDPSASIESTVSGGLNAVSTNTTLRALNNGSIRSSASKRYWTLLNQPVPEVNPAP